VVVYQAGRQSKSSSMLSKIALKKDVVEAKLAVYTELYEKIEEQLATSRLANDELKDLLIFYKRIERLNKELKEQIDIFKQMIVILKRQLKNE
jgi:hypothetical protein